MAMAPSCVDLLQTAAFAGDAPCKRDSGFSFYTIVQAPTVPEINRICSSPQCSKVIAAIRNVMVKECQISKSDNGELSLYKDVLDPIAKVCSKGAVVVTGLPTTTAPTPESTPSRVSKSNSSEASKAEDAPATVTTAPPSPSATRTAVPSPSATKSSAPTHRRAVAHALVVAALAIVAQA